MQKEQVGLLQPPLLLYKDWCLTGMMQQCTMFWTTLELKMRTKASLILLCFILRLISRDPAKCIAVQVECLPIHDDCHLETRWSFHGLTRDHITLPRPATNWWISLYSVALYAQYLSCRIPQQIRSWEEISGWHIDCSSGIRSFGQTLWVLAQGFSTCCTSLCLACVSLFRGLESKLWGLQDLPLMIDGVMVPWRVCKKTFRTPETLL